MLRAKDILQDGSVAPASGERTQRDAKGAATRARILQSALKHFSARGFDGASVREISAGAGVTHAVIRLHYETKENLWRAAIDYLIEDQRKTINALRMVPDKLNPESFEKMVRGYVHYCAENPDYMRITIHETIRDSDLLRWMVDKHLSPIHHHLRLLFERAIEEKIIFDGPIESIMYIFISACQMIFALRVEAKQIYGTDVLDLAFVKQHADTVVKMLIKPSVS